MDAGLFQLGVTVEQMTTDDVWDLLLEVYPRKVTMLADESGRKLLKKLKRK